MKKTSPKIHRKMQEIYANNNAILQINLKNLEKNYKKLKFIAPNSQIAACVKANSYGLGTEQVIKILYKLKCKNFFVATAEEAILLRQKYKNINIYLLNGVTNLNTYLKIKNFNVITVINNIYQLNILKKAYKLTKSKIKCCIHIDTGMNRLGLSFEELLINLNKIIEYLEIKLVMSHMVNSEKNSKLNNRQLKLFQKIKNSFKSSKNINFSLSNSNAAFLSKSFHFDIIRAGGYLYGLDLNIKNKSNTVLTLKAKIIQIQNVKKGNSVGYGATFITKKESKIATIAIGYADGLPRDYKGYAFYKNTKVRFVGRLSMDLSCIDISKIKDAKINDWVEIFGTNISIYNFATNSKTIPYEISSKIGPRVKRVYDIVFN
jgi:alanine racemase